MRAAALAVLAAALAAATIAATPPAAAAPLAQRAQMAGADRIARLTGRSPGNAVATIDDTAGPVGGRPPFPGGEPAGEATSAPLSGASQVFYEPDAGIVGFRDAATGLDILDTANPALSGYGRNPSIGPVSSTAAVDPGGAIADADRTDPALDSSAVSATVLGGAPLAEPGATALLAAGLAALLALGGRVPPQHARG